ncbi:hypothetical protein [Roseibium sediminicola]|uniref:Tellurite resistance protein TerB n=1 Tax=Roseibium sediminicola TaxID=2933272 RepID=A0ABT0GZ32_9HYPH|nr:hypothetical protein [Roseibium sp. CAU 1639]MCK7614591.1 hypothetical protein [Roseibium sp. CAU 1639]
MGESQAINAWSELEGVYKTVQTQVNGFMSEASICGVNLIRDVPTRIEYMTMIRAEADAMLEQARANKKAAKEIFDRIFERRNELRLIQQNKATATTNIISKLITKDRTKAQLLIKAAKQLAEEGKISVQIADGVSDAEALKKIMATDDFDDVLIKAIDNAGGSRKTISPTNMKVRGAGLLILTVALAGFDIYTSQDKSFATTKNVSSIAGGAGGAWALAAAGLAVGGPVGGAIGLLVGGFAGSYAAEEIHFQARGINVNPKINELVQKHFGWSADEDGLAYDAHKEFLGDMVSVYLLFSNLNEKRNSDADDVAVPYIKVAQKVLEKHPNGALADGLKSKTGQALIDLLYAILDAGWTDDVEYSLMSWLKKQKGAK